MMSKREGSGNNWGKWNRKIYFPNHFWHARQCARTIFSLSIATRLSDVGVCAGPKVETAQSWKLKAPALSTFGLDPKLERSCLTQKWKPVSQSDNSWLYGYFAFWLTSKFLILATLIQISWDDCNMRVRLFEQVVLTLDQNQRNSVIWWCLLC